MKLIIDIDDKRIKGIKLLAKEQDIATPYPTLEQIIANGIPLPKGHGALKDVDTIKPKFCNSNIYIKYGEKGFWYYSVKDVNDAPTIIEADKAERSE